jgi:hypothetical protein
MGKGWAVVRTAAAGARLAGRGETSDAGVAQAPLHAREGAVVAQFGQARLNLAALLSARSAR